MARPNTLSLIPPFVTEAIISEPDIDVFVSYAREDQDVALELAREMERGGFSLFLDRDIQPGAPYEEAIEAKLSTARCVVVIWSRASVASRWVKAEAEAGATRGVLLPVVIEDVRVPLAFRALETLSILGWPERSNVLGVQRLLKALRSIVDGAEHRPPSSPEHSPRSSDQPSRRPLSCFCRSESLPKLSETVGIGFLIVHTRS